MLYIIGAKVRIFFGLCKRGREIFYGEFRDVKEFREVREFKDVRASSLTSLISLLRPVPPRNTCHTLSHLSRYPHPLWHCDTVTLWHCDIVILGVVLSVLITLITRNNTTPTPCDNVISWFCDLGVRVGSLTMSCWAKSKHLLAMVGSMSSWVKRRISRFVLPSTATQIWGYIAIAKWPYNY